MRVFVIGFGLLLLSLLPADAPAAELRADISPGLVRQDVFPQTRVHFAGGVVAVPDIEYANLPGYRPLLLDLYTQDKPKHTSPRPLVIYIHGGNWDRGDSRVSGAFTDFPAVLASLAARGYVVASINYRLAGEAHFPAQVQDINAAIGFLRAHAAQYGIDASRVVLWGGSSGGHLAALAAASCGEAAFQPQPSMGRFGKFAAHPAGRAAAPGCVQGAVVWYGIFDFRPLLSPNPAFAAYRVAISKFLGCRVEDCPSAVDQLSPITHVCASTPPMLLIHGDDDTMVPAEQSRSMAERLRQAGVAVETLFIPHVGHGFIGKTPAATRRASLLALRRSFDFIDRITKPEAAPIGIGLPAKLPASVLAAD